MLLISSKVLVVAVTPRGSFSRSRSESTQSSAK